MDPADRPPAADASVRGARAADVPALGQVQARAWRATYAELLPARVLDALEPAALAQAWGRAVAAPPTRASRVLVALAGERVVGLAATGPSTDPDAEAGADGELVALVVDPGARGAGHGSRLLNAAVDHLRGDAFTRVRAWVPVADEARTAFLTRAGLAPDGARRELDVTGDGTALVAEVRLAADLDAAARPPDPS